MKKLLLPILSIILLASSCTKQVNTNAPQKVSSNSQWVQELMTKNPLKDSTNITSVYSLKTGKEYCYTTWDGTCGCFSSHFMSINITNIVSDKRFCGYKNGDAYIFRYNTTIDTTSDNSLLPYAEYQFYDADFDGEDELIIGSYVGGPHGSPCYAIYDMTDLGLVEKKAEGENGYFGIDTSTKFDAVNKTITSTIYVGAYAWGEYVYKVSEEGQCRLFCHMYFESDFDHNIIHSDTTYYR